MKAQLGSSVGCIWPIYRRRAFGADHFYSYRKVPVGNENWRSYRAIDEIEIYCDLLENLQNRKDTLRTRSKDEDATLTNAQAGISSYALEIAMKSLWALD